MASAALQDIVERALAELVEDRRRRERFDAVLVPPAAAQLSAAVVNALGLCWNALNTLFQAAVAAQRFGDAGNLKSVMDQISLTAAAIDEKIVAMYEADAAATTAALNHAVAGLKKAKDDTIQDAGSSGEIASAVSDLAKATHLPG